MRDTNQTTPRQRPVCGGCGATAKLWQTCVGVRCPACPCDAPKHGSHTYDYEFNGERCYVKDGAVVVERIGQ